MKLPPVMSPYLTKINFVALSLAVLVFMLPWSDIQCNGRDVATQSGLQSVWGGVSLSDEFEQLGAADSPGGDESGKDDIGIGLITFVVLLCVLAGAIIAGLVVFMNKPPVIDPAILACVALLLLVVQVVIGFPVDRAVKGANQDMGSGPRDGAVGALGNESPSIFGAQPKSGGPNPDEALARGLSAAMGIKTQRTGWFYLELLLLAIPTALLIYQRLPETSATLSQPAPLDTPTNPD